MRVSISKDAKFEISWNNKKFSNSFLNLLFFIKLFTSLFRSMATALNPAAMADDLSTAGAKVGLELNVPGAEQIRTSIMP